MEFLDYAARVAESQAVWSILCILTVGYVFYYSNKRENRLLDNLEKLTIAQNDQAQTMKIISANLTTLEGRMDRMEKHTYKVKGDK